MFWYYRLKCFGFVLIFTYIRIDVGCFMMPSLYNKRRTYFVQGLKTLNFTPDNVIHRLNT